MLTDLSIRNLALVDRLDLAFKPGMSVITGETGAGKSIMLGALGLALGDRADLSLLAKGVERAEINATFELDGCAAARAWLRARALADEGQCILRRVLSSDGRTRAFVNGSAMNVADLKEIGDMLMDLHSQHEHQSLLRRGTHLRLLDAYGGTGGDAARLAGIHREMTEAGARLASLVESRDDQNARAELLTYQLGELNELAVAEGEVEALGAEHKRLQNADTSYQKLGEARALLDKEADGSASTQLRRAAALLDGIDDAGLKPLQETLASLLIQLDEAASDLGGLLGAFEADPARLQEVDARLGRLFEVARKHKVETRELVRLTADMAAELAAMGNRDAEIAELETRHAALKADYLALAGRLSAARAQSRERLEAEVQARLASLGMGGAVFKVRLDPIDESAPRETGLDEVEFLIATIPGMAPRALNRIASGGELSRISLAIQVVTAHTSETPSLVFDEVDAGIGGATAEVVGSLLRQLGGAAQVICVTHLPQVAAQGQHHFVVSKQTSPDSARTSVTPLAEEERVAEIARMLGGREQTEQSLAHARAMIAGAAQEGQESQEAAASESGAAGLAAGH